jgi:hypothetical protein
MGELTGIGGYASLLKTQKNPYDRDLTSTQAVMNQMPKDGGVTGLEGLGKIPLMYQMGVDTANAKAFDEQKAIEENQQVQGVMDYQRQKDIQDQQAKKLAMAIDLSRTDYKAANQLLAQSQPELADKIQFAGNDKDGWKDIEVKGDDGYTTRGYLNPKHFEELNEAKQNGTLNQATIKALFDQNFAPYSRYETKDVNVNKVTGHLVRDPDSSTGYSYLGDDGEIMAQNAPTPAELHPRPVGSGGSDDKAFMQWAGKLQSLRGRIASIQKGIDPYTGGTIPQANIDAALSGLLPEVENTKRLMQSKFPDQYATYFGDESALAQPKPIQGDASKHMLLSAAPAGPKKTLDGVQYYKAKDGKWYQE